VLFKILKYITPLSLAALGAIAAVMYLLLDTATASEAKGMMIPGLLIVTAVCVCLDILARFIFKNKLHWIWLSEALAILVLVYIWIIQ